MASSAVEEEDTGGTMKALFDGLVMLCPHTMGAVGARKNAMCRPQLGYCPIGILSSVGMGIGDHPDCSSSLLEPHLQS